MAYSILRAVVAGALCGTVGAAASAQDRSQLPIKVEARSSNFDTQSNQLLFDTITISQGDIRISAQSARASGLDFEDSGWEFSGTVRIATPESALASETARVRFTGGRIESATVTGKPATFEQRAKEKLAKGHALRIDYDLGRGTVELAGEAWLTDGRNELTGATLVYSTVNQRVMSNKPVVFTINPPEKVPQAPAPAPKKPE